jgi:hypothetical protein
VRRAIRAAGAHLLFLPPYSPDLNPIEMMFAKLKTLLPKADARSPTCLSDCLATLLNRFPPWPSTGAGDVDGPGPHGWYRTVHTITSLRPCPSHFAFPLSPATAAVRW